MCYCAFKSIDVFILLNIFNGYGPEERVTARLPSSQQGSHCIAWKFIIRALRLTTILGLFVFAMCSLCLALDVQFNFTFGKC